MQMPSELASQLLATARYGASSLMLAQASGGNNSVKSLKDDVLWVKASGFRLADMSEKAGFTALRCSEVRNVVTGEKNSPAPADVCTRRKRHEDAVRNTQCAALGSSQGRASLETGFHSLLGNIVLHLHPVYLNAFTCMQGGKELFAKIAPSPFTWIPYAAPGQELAVKIEEALRDTTEAKNCCLMLENHGFVAAGESGDEVIATTRRFLNTAREFFGDLSQELIHSQPAPKDAEKVAAELCAFYREHASSLVIRPARFAVFNQSQQLQQFFATPGPLVPDDVVYWDGTVHKSSLSSVRKLTALLGDSLPERLAIAVEGGGLVLLARNENLAAAMEEMLAAHLLVRMLISRKGKIQTLATAEIEYLQGMESEKYRLKLSAKGAC